MSQADQTTTSRRTLLTRAVAVSALTGAVGANVAAISVTTERDPIFAAIEQHRRARGACTTTAPNDDLFNVAIGEEIDAFGALLDTVPTSLEGVAAVLAHLSSPAYYLQGNVDHETTLWNGFNCYRTQEAAAEYPGRLAQALRRMITLEMEGRAR
jgi:hypothetical protein